MTYLSRALFLSLLLFAAAAPARAQDAAPQPAPERPSRVVRVFGELGGAVAGAALGSLPLVLAVETAKGDCRKSDAFTCGISGFGTILAGFGGFVVLTTFAVTAGTYFVGDALGGDGRFWLTLLGTLGGGLISTLVVSEIADATDTISLPAFIITIDIGPVLGSVFLYELTNRADDPPRDPNAFRWSPTVAALPASQGAVLGVAGAF